MTINAAFGLIIAFVVSLGLSHVRHTYLGGRMKRLYVDEVTCPKCGARPNVPCFFAGGYACIERWNACIEENNKREALRDKSSRAGRK